MESLWLMGQRSAMVSADFEGFEFPFWSFSSVL